MGYKQLPGWNIKRERKNTTMKVQERGRRQKPQALGPFSESLVSQSGHRRISWIRMTKSKMEAHLFLSPTD